MTATPRNDDPILVIGGTGKTGRRVVERLEARAIPVRVGSRSHSETPFDWYDPSTWPAALDGVTTAYVSFHPDLAFPGAAEIIGAFAEQAVARGARRLVLLSGRGEDGAVHSEDQLKASGADWTVIRSTWFQQNFGEDWLLEPVLSGVIALPAGDVAEPFVDVEDIADVAVAALTEDGHVGETYEVTGPRLVTFADAAAELTAAIGRHVAYLPVTEDQWLAAAVAEGMPSEVAQGLAGVFAQVLDGRNAHLTDGVQRALGREPADFRDYVRRTAATGVWSVPAIAGEVQS
jgi:uncharacterized protein YbjT (DUF2867 family)